MKGSAYARKAFHIVRRCFTPGAVILLYHRVAALPEDPYSLAVTPDRFCQHLEYISQTCSPMPLSDLVDAMRSRDLPRRAVAVTFDDGYSDNYWEAHPLLESAQIPATIFVTSDQVDSTRDAAPLRQVAEAVLLDTSDLTFDEAVKAALDLIQNWQPTPK